jgi:sorbitol-specific phosphotransferase system component IIBC
MSIVWYVEVLQKTTAFRRLDLSPSSGGWGRVNLLSWARQKELVSITGPSGGWGRVDLLSWARQKELVSITGPSGG